MDKIQNQLVVEEAYKKIENTSVKTAIRYVGGKGRKKNKYTELMPKHDIFVSLFTGGASVELFKQPSKIEVINDINKELINLLNVIRDRSDELMERASALPYSEELYEQYQNSEVPEDELERAIRYFYIVRCSFNGGGAKYKSGISLPTSKTLKNTAKEYQNSIKLIKEMSRRMKNWIILSRDFEEVIERYDSPKTLFFSDSPYYKREHFYHGDFNKEDHIRLNQLAKSIKGKIMICYDGKYEFIDELYKDFVKIEYPSKIYMSRKEKGVSCKEGSEVIYLNYKME